MLNASWSLAPEVAAAACSDAAHVPTAMLISATRWQQQDLQAPLHSDTFTTGAVTSGTIVSVCLWRTYTQICQGRCRCELQRPPAEPALVSRWFHFGINSINCGKGGINCYLHQSVVRRVSFLTDPASRGGLRKHIVLDSSHTTWLTVRMSCL